LHLIKKIGTNLCHIDENFLSESALNQKKKKASKVANLKDTVATKDAQGDNKKQEDAGKKKKKKELKENKKPNVDSNKDVQDEEGANQGGAAPKKKAKNEELITKRRKNLSLHFGLLGSLPLLFFFSSFSNST
jgi:hypothetical protein